MARNSVRPESGSALACITDGDPGFSECRLIGRWAFLSGKVSGKEGEAMRYSVKIVDPSTDRQCEVFVATDRDLETLLLFLTGATGLKNEVRELTEGMPDS